MTNRKPITVGLIQMAMTANPEKNLSKAANFVVQAARKGAKIICLPELFKTLYFPQKLSNKKIQKLAENVPGPTTALFAKLAKRLGAVIIVPIYEKTRQGRYYNSAAVLDATGKFLPVYRKVHLPQDPLFYEKSYFSEGDQGFRVYKTSYGRFAVLICYDQWFPEAARLATLKGAEIIFYPTAIGNIAHHRAPEGDWHEAWETIQRGHAIANGVHVAVANRVGREGKLLFWGQSFVADSFGKVLARASKSKEQILICKLNLAQNKLVREGWGFLRNRRPDVYR